MERFSYNLEMKTREQNRNKRRTEIEWFDWFIKQIQTHVAFGWLSKCLGGKFHARELSQNQPILRFDVKLQHHWPIKQRLLHIGVFFGGKTNRPCFYLFSHWLIKQITNTYWNHFSRSYKNRSNIFFSDWVWTSRVNQRSRREPSPSRCSTATHS